jgi:hypothetical protein
MSRGTTPTLAPNGRRGALRRDTRAGLVDARLVDEVLRIEILEGDAMVEPRLRDVKHRARSKGARQ